MCFDECSQRRIRQGTVPGLAVVGSSYLARHVDILSDQVKENRFYFIHFVEEEGVVLSARKLINRARQCSTDSWTGIHICDCVQCSIYTCYYLLST